MNIKERIKRITEKIARVYYSIKHKNTPWYAKVMGSLAVGYALSPIDLIPDFIPILGYLDDFIILPILIALTIKMIPKEIWDESEEAAKDIWKDGKPKKWFFAIPIILLWAFLITYIIRKVISN